MKIQQQRRILVSYIGKGKMNTWLNKIGPNTPIGVSLFWAMVSFMTIT